jgi:uncharacterized RDD family membrane protein YckC
MTSEQGPSATVLGQYAGFTTRLIAYVVDQLIRSGILGMLAVGIRLITDAIGFDLAALKGTAALVVAGILLGISVSVVLLYDVGFWMLAGQTPGKRLMGVRIVRTDGRRLTLWNCLRRVVGYLISRILYLGYLWVLVDSKRQAWHDHLAGTYVVYAWPEVEQRPWVRERLWHSRKEDPQGAGTEAPRA